jgi:aminoglycoside phosphotransferase (APT) family kinase protein
VVRVVPLRVIDSGWDSRVVDIAGRRILRIARNQWARDGYAVEAKLLPRLAPHLPVQVPMPLRRGERWTLTRRIPGQVIGSVAHSALGAEAAAFVAALHAFPVADARAAGVRDERREVDLKTFRELVLPLLGEDERDAGEQLLVEHERARFEPVLVHADLGPEHILVNGRRISGVIDWTDARIGDPAIDLAWPLYGAPAEFAATFAATYGVDGRLARRALVHHALGPWHEVVHGLRTDRRWVATGLDGVRARLRRVADDAATMDQ